MSRRKVTPPAPPAAPKPVVTPEVAADRRLEAVLYNARNAVRRENERMADWVARFADDAAYALEWSREIFESAAREKMGREILAYQEHMTRNADEYTMPTARRILDVMTNELTREALNRARWPSHSTSAPSNLMDQALNAARAEWVVCLQGIDSLSVL